MSSVNKTAKRRPTDELSPRRRRTRLARANQVREAAMTLVDEEGPESLTIQRLADKLDWAPGTLYRYFACKEALLMDLRMSLIEELTENLHKRLMGLTVRNMGQPDDVMTLAQLMETARFVTRVARNYEARARLMLMPMVEESPEDGDTLLGVDMARGLLESAQASGALHPGDSLDRARLLGLAMRGVLVDVNRTGEEKSELVRKMVGSLLGGWGANAQALEQATALTSR